MNLAELRKELTARGYEPLTPEQMREALRYREPVLPEEFRKAGVQRAAEIYRDEIERRLGADS